MIEKRELLNELYDYYGAMLTEKQKNNFNLYYREDFSLAEIAEGEKVSRNAIYDNLKRTEKILLNMEDKLGFCKRIKTIKEDIKKISGEIIKTQKIKDSEQRDKIKTYIEEIAENI